jgi:hypothetical protein
MIHHQWPLEVTDVTSIGFFIGETPTYKLSSTFRVDLCTLIEKKTKIHRRNIPMFQVALTVVRARMENPKTKKFGREACTAFELQVPVGQREAMEKILKKTFLGTTANDLQFIQQHDVLLMGDFNEDLETDSDGLRDATMGLIDLMQVKIGHRNFSTHIDGHNRIDFAFATPRAVAACSHAGYEPFRHRFEMDPRGFYLDLDNAVLFGNQ